MINPGNPLAATVRFKTKKESRLKYWVLGTALEVTASKNPGEDEITFTILNSKGSQSTGYITMPKENLEELIADLVQLRSNIRAVQQTQ